MKEQIELIVAAARKAVAAASDEKQIDEIRVKYLGKKGELTALLKQMGSLSPEERPIMGQMVNDVKLAIECKKPVYHYGRTGGMIPSPEEILQKIQEYSGGNA